MWRIRYGLLMGNDNERKEMKIASSRLLAILNPILILSIRIRHTFVFADESTGVEPFCSFTSHFFSL